MHTTPSNARASVKKTEYGMLLFSMVTRRTICDDLMIITKGRN